MEKITFKFGTPKPLTFREPECDTDFNVRIAGMVEVSDYDAARYGGGEEGIVQIKQTIVDLLQSCLLNWPEDKYVMCDGNREILAGLLDKALADVGITAGTNIAVITLPSDQEAEYNRVIEKKRVDSFLKKMCPEPSLSDDDDDEIHGPLVSFCYSLSSHGMMMGSSSYTSYSVDWHDDGTVTMSIQSSGGGKNSFIEYKLKNESAEKLRDLVKSKHLAALTKKKIETVMCCDSFTSATIGMTFDDSSIGGSRCKLMNLNCGPAGMTFRTLENAVSEIIKECRDTGECTSVAETKTAESTMLGFFNIGSIPTRQKEPAQPQQTGEGWTCTKCGCSGNTGKFCPECGSRRQT